MCFKIRVIISVTQCHSPPKSSSILMRIFGLSLSKCSDPIWPCREVSMGSKRRTYSPDPSSQGGLYPHIHLHTSSCVPIPCRQDRVKGSAFSQQMPCRKVLAWHCPVASAIRQGRLISQSEIHGGNADELNKQQVPGPQGWGVKPYQPFWGRGKDKQVLSKEPFTYWPLQPLFQR